MSLSQFNSRLNDDVVVSDRDLDRWTDKQTDTVIHELNYCCVYLNHHPLNKHYTSCQVTIKPTY